MLRIIDDSELAARLRLHRLHILALLVAGGLLGAGLQALPPVDEASAASAQTPSALTAGEPLQLRMSTRLQKQPAD